MWSTSSGTLPVVGFISPQPHCEHLKLACSIRYVLIGRFNPCSKVPVVGSFIHAWTVVFRLLLPIHFAEQYLEALLLDLYSEKQKLQTFGPFAFLVPLTPGRFLAFPRLLNLAEQLLEQNFCSSSLYWKSCLHSTHCLVLSFLGLSIHDATPAHFNEQYLGLLVSVSHTKHFMYIV